MNKSDNISSNYSYIYPTPAELNPMDLMVVDQTTSFRLLFVNTILEINE